MKQVFVIVRAMYSQMELYYNEESGYWTHTFEMGTQFDSEEDAITVLQVKASKTDTGPLEIRDYWIEK